MFVLCVAPHISSLDIAVILSVVSRVPIWRHYISNLETSCSHVWYIMYPNLIHHVSNLDTSCIQIGYIMYPDWIHHVSNLDTSCIQSVYIMYPDWIHDVCLVTFVSRLDRCIQIGTWCIQIGYMMYPDWIHNVSRLDLYLINIAEVSKPY